MKYGWQKVDWEKVDRANNAEYTRILPHFQKFCDDHSEWTCSLWVASYPPEVMLSFYLDPSVRLSRRRTILSNPSRVACLTDEEMAIPATFVAEIMGEMRVKRMSRDTSILDYQLRLNYDKYPRIMMAQVKV